MDVKSRRWKTALVIAIPVLLLIIFILKDQIMGLSRYLGGCALYTLTGIFCPGCGNTRSLRALLHLHPWIAVRNNPAMPTLAIIGFLGYVELICGAFGKKIRILPRSIIFWYSVLGVFGLYYIIRNFFPVLQPIS